MSDLKNVHPLAQSAFSISGASGLYDRARPSYPESAMAHIFAAAQRISPETGVDVVELGPGTGIFTRLLLSDPSIKSIIGVEPSPGMREGFQKSLPNIPIKPGSFTSIPLPDKSADMICVAQAFHWAHPNYDAAASEFARVLRPGGVLVLIWNLEDREKADWVARIRDAYEEFEDGTPQYRHFYWEALFDTPSYMANFQPRKGAQFESIQRALETDEQGVVDRVLSKSYITNLDDKRKVEVEERVRTVLKDASIDQGDRKRIWIDKENGVFEYPYRTDLVVIKRN